MKLVGGAVTMYPRSELVPRSDTDVRGVYVAPAPWTQGLVVPPQELLSLDGSTTCWEIDKTIRQALRADPNTLEMLFVDTNRAVDPMGHSAELYGVFGRYAVSQLHELRCPRTQPTVPRPRHGSSKLDADDFEDAQRVTMSAL